MIAPRTFQSVTCIVFSIVVYPTQETFIKNSRELRVEIIKMTTINDVDMCINYMCMLENTTKDSYKQTNKHSTIFCYNLAIVYKKKKMSTITKTTILLQSLTHSKELLGKYRK